MGCREREGGREGEGGRGREGGRESKREIERRRRQLVWATTSLLWPAKEFRRKNSSDTRRNSTARRTRRSTSRPNRIGSTEGPNASRPRARKLAEMQESLRVRKETLKAAYEEIKILRENLLREGESMDKNKSHIMSPENTEEVRILEQQELKLKRGAAAKRLAGWTREGSTEEIASWSVEAERISREVEVKNRKLFEAIEKESTMKDVRMSDEGADGLDGSLAS